MQTAEHLTVLERDGVRLAEAAAEAGLDTPVPTCPGWRVRDLVVHQGGVHRWAMAVVDQRRMTPFTPDEERVFFAAPGAGGPGADPTGGTGPDGPTPLLEWFRAGHRDLLEVLGAATEETQCWSFLAAPSPLAFWARRQAHETAIHCADAYAARGGRPTWSPRFAADGVDELLVGFFGRGGGRRLRSDPPRRLAVVATDVDAAWTMEIGPAGRRVVPAREPADLTVTGAANSLYLWLWNRSEVEGLSIDGDRELLTLWRERATVRWG